MKKTILFGLCMLILLVSSANAVPEPYNLSSMGNASGIVGLAQGVNDVLMKGYFGVLLLVTIFMITFLGFFATTAHAGKSIVASSFIAFALSILLRAINLIPDATLYISLAIFGLSIAFLNRRR